MLRTLTLPPASACHPLRLAARRYGTLLAAQPWATSRSSLPVHQRSVAHTHFLFATPAGHTTSRRLAMCTQGGGIIGQNVGAARLLHTSPLAMSTKPAAEQKPDAAPTESRAATEGANAAAASEPSAKPKSAHNEAMKASTAAAGEAASDTNAGPSTEGTASTEKERKEEKQESWWRRKWRSFKSEGKDFSLFYLPFYPATFVLLYAAFATEALHKESILDYVLSWMGDYVDRKKMYERVEAWNTWANIGFAFVINELIEVVRFPAIVILYYATKPYSTRFAHWMLKFLRRFRRSKSKPDAKVEPKVESRVESKVEVKAEEKS